MLISGKATAEGTAHYASRFQQLCSNQFFRKTADWTVSSLGIGTYLGGLDSATSRNYVEAVRAGLRGGINFIDTSLNYRHQRSERDVGRAICEQINASETRRDEFVVATKAGYLEKNAVPNTVRHNDIVGENYSIAPAFLTDQLDRSRQNLGLETIDVFYLHNPETLLAYLSDEEVYWRFQEAFRDLEYHVAQGRISYYGVATWNAFRQPSDNGHGLSLTRLIRLAREIASDQHHFRFVQLPFNFAMSEPFTKKYDDLDGRPATVLEIAAKFGLTVVASASLMQAKLAKDLPSSLAEHLSGPQTDAQRAIQFTRSTPGITVGLVGMSNPAHVEENLGVAQFAPATPHAYMKIFS